MVYFVFEDFLFFREISEFLDSNKMFIGVFFQVYIECNVKVEKFNVFFFQENEIFKLNFEFIVELVWQNRVFQFN